MSKNKSTWKHCEREIAKRLGARRVGPTGIATPDVVVGDWLLVEVKHRKTLPAWLLGALDQVEQHATEAQLPIAVLHGERMRYDDSLVVLRLDDFVEWFGDANN